MIVVSTRRIVVSVTAMTLIGGGGSYRLDARLRSLCELKDRNIEYSPNGLYEARYCYFKDAIVLRVYERNGTRILAERTYRYTSGVPVRLYWKPHVLQYADDNEDLATISLPPSLYDRLMAKLP